MTPDMQHRIEQQCHGSQRVQASVRPERRNWISTTVTFPVIASHYVELPLSNR